jgi:hypothetical protein
VRVNQHYLSRHAASERSRLMIDGIAERLNCLEDLFPCFGSDMLNVVEHSGHGDASHSCRLGNVVDRGFAAAHARRLASVFANHNFRLSAQSPSDVSRARISGRPRALGFSGMGEK